jgi:PAS domain S-box-containing protein
MTAPARILIVEDEAVVAHALQATLQGLGYKPCDVAYTATQAVNAALAQQPDVVLMDIRLEATADGIGAAEEILRRAGIPVIFVTAYSDDETLARVEAAGMYGYILKPVEEGSLRIAIEMALSRHRMEKDVRDKEEWLNILLGSISDGVIATDPAGRIVRLNIEAERLTGWSEGEALGKPVDEVLTLIDEKTRQRCANPVANVIATGKAMDFGNDTLLIARDGTEHAIAESGAPIRDRACRISGVVFTFRDIAAQRQADADLRRAKELADAAAQLQAEFVSKVSHELRTPLTSMTYAARNLQKGVAGPVSESVIRYARMIDGECQRMLKTVNDVLDMRKIQNKTLILAEVRLPIARLIARTVETLRLQSESKMVRLNFAADSATECLACDPEKIVRVVQNIVGNAIKFTPPRGAVRVRLSRDSDRSGMVLLTVEDSGIGIPAAEMGNVTQPYYQVGKQTTGSGLGLSISNEIVELHGGSLSIQSPPPGRSSGSLVTVRLPSAAAPLALVVDDDPVMRKLIEEQLTPNGYQVIAVSGGNEALRRVETRVPQIMLVDLILDDLSGCELIVKLKHLVPLRTMPIVALTGGNVDGDKYSVLSDFAIPTLCKPWREDELLDVIETAMIGSAVFRG